VTLIGRAAVPAWPVEIEVVDAASSTALAVRNSHLRAKGWPLAFDAAKPKEVTYQNPVQPSAAPVPLKANQRRHFITPYGGPLMLVYNGAKAGDVVKLRIRGAATYAHLDFTQPTPVSDEQIREMENRIQNDVLGWMTMKFVGGEVQQKISLARDAWMSYSRGSLNDYLRHGLTEDVFKVNHWANGYSNVTHTPTVVRLCAELAWDCNSSLHRAPGVQHYVGWIAACGFMCSGNPVDAYAGFGPGWGMAHELGHNTVQRVHRITFSDVDFDTGNVVSKGCHSECDNNILSVVTGLAEWSRHGVNIGSGRAGTRELYTKIRAWTRPRPAA
jgi:immunomodulating metalloprotease